METDLHLTLGKDRPNKAEAHFRAFCRNTRRASNVQMRKISNFCRIVVEFQGGGQQVSDGVLHCSSAPATSPSGPDSEDTSRFSGVGNCGRKRPRGHYNVRLTTCERWSSRAGTIDVFESGDAIVISWDNKASNLCRHSRTSNVASISAATKGDALVRFGSCCQSHCIVLSENGNNEYNIILLRSLLCVF